VILLVSERPAAHFLEAGSLCDARVLLRKAVRGFPAGRSGRWRLQLKLWTVVMSPLISMARPMIALSFLINDIGNPRFKIGLQEVAVLWAMTAIR